MKIKIRLLVIAACLVNCVFAQTPASLPSSYGSVPINYVRTWDAIKPATDANAIMGYDVQDVRMATQYIDGLGRSLQTVVKKGSMATGHAAKDLVSSTVYDAFGREAIKYLPYADAGTNGLFKTNPFTPQVGFYNTQLNGQGGEINVGPNNLNWAYSQTNFEASPLNRPTESFAPGVSWVGSSGQPTEAARKSVKTKYWINTTDDGVRIWNVDNTGGPGGFDGYITTATYDAGQLYKNVTVDEHGKQVIEFKDKEGKVILKKVQIGNTADNGTGVGHTVDWLCTYYIYDDLNQLSCVIQPEAVKIIGSPLTPSWTLTPELLYEQCFRYKYDHRGQMVMKKVPGAEYVDMVYDTRDRLIITQDAVQRAANPRKWTYINYDALNRPITTGIFEWNAWAHSFRAATRVQDNYLQAHFSIENIVPEILTITHYDDYVGLPSELTSYLSTWNNSSYFETNANVWPYAQMPTVSNATKGMVTWTSTRILGSNDFLHTVNYYDEKGRVIQVQSTNLTTGRDVITTQYTWAGQPYITVQQQTAGTQILTTLSKINYDDLGRVLSIEKKKGHSAVNSGALDPSFKTIVQHEYDQLGQLKNKKLAPAYNSGAGLETLSYDYNIRGWMLGMNREYAKDANSNNYFGFDLGYDKASNGLIGNKAYTTAQYNGNITGMVWKSKGDAEKRKYDFAYDNANRLLKADFTQYTAGNFDQTANVNYDVKMGDGITATSAYDANGNIKRMQQWGLKLNSSSQVDDLIYQYTSNSNKLLSVTENTLGNTDNKLGDFTDKNGSNDDYAYDVNGNLNLDKNKSISSISYNHLNLPALITVTGKGTIAYTYDAAGIKLKKQTTETGVAITHNGTAYTGITVTSTTTYIGGAVYESKAYSNANTTPHTALNTALGYSNKLQFTGHEEGRLRAKYSAAATPSQEVITGFEYDYMIKDHLGNVRMVLTEELKQDIYPAATLENITHNGNMAISTEADFYTIHTGNIVAQGTATGIPVYQNNNGNPPENNNPYSNTTANSSRLYLLNAATNTVANKAGLGIVLKVMSGDKINIFGNSYHKRPAGGYSSSTNPLSVANIIDLFTGVPAIAGKGISSGSITGGAGFPSSISSLLNNPPAQNSYRPRAGINWIMLDEQFKYVSGGFDMVDEANVSPEAFKEHKLTGLDVGKNGYVYVWCSNESQYNVFFDNLQLIHDKGAILEETHYYPFGLTMAGISSISAGGLENRKKYNGIEFENDLQLDIYDAQFRELDAQTGRWWQIDPKTDEMFMWSTYASNFDNPIRFEDFLGDIPSAVNCCPNAIGLWQSTVNSARSSGPYGKPIIVAGAIATAAVFVAEGITAIGKVTATVGENAEAITAANLIEHAKSQLPANASLALANYALFAEHTKNARSSTKGTHEKGQARQKQQREGSKGMKQPPRIKPPGHKGPWPPKPPAPPPPKPPATPPPNLPVPPAGS